MVPVPMGVGSPPTEPSRVGPPGRVGSPVQRHREEFREDLVAAPVADSPVRFQEGRGVRLPMDREAFPDRLPPVGCREVNPVRSRGALAARLRTDPAVFRGRLLAAGSRARSPVVLPMGLFPAALVVSLGMAPRAPRALSREVPQPERCPAGERGFREGLPAVRVRGQARVDFPAHLVRGGCRGMRWPQVVARWVVLQGACPGEWGRWEPVGECQGECPEERA